MTACERVGIAVSTLGTRPELHKLVSFCLENSLVISIADQSTHGIVFPKEQINNKSLIIERSGALGASNGRNIAITNLPHEIDFVFTLNDCSIPSINFIAESVCLFDLFPDLIAIGGLYEYANGKHTGGKTGFLREANISSIIEPAMILRLEGLETNRTFNPRLGPGSNTILASGEGTDLLYRLYNKKKRILMLNAIASFDFREVPIHSVATDFKYGLSFGVVNKFYVSNLFVVLRIFTPLLRRILRISKGDSPEKVVNLIAICAGRFFALSIPNILVKRFWMDK